MSSVLSLFQALADPTRLRILALLRAMELSVGELAQVLGQSQPRVSRHVKTLLQSELISRRREGNWIFLMVGEDALIGPALAAMDAWPEGDLGEQLRTDALRLKAISVARVEAAQEFFETHASVWDAIRSRHVPEIAVEREILNLVGAGRTGSLVDIGTGTGRMLELLAGQADSLTGFDRSPSMLRLARARLLEAGVTHADVRQGDFYALPLPDSSADLAIMHQVLHHAHQPIAALTEAARILKPGGRFLLVDFGPHDQESFRQIYAHVHLGFSGAQMEKLFSRAGLDIVRFVALDGDLTVCLWLAEKPIVARD